MLAFPEKQDRHLAGFDKTDRSSVTAFAQWGLTEVPWVPSLFPGLMEVQHMVRASREGDSAVHWLLPVPIRIDVPNASEVRHFTHELDNPV